MEKMQQVQVLAETSRSLFEVQDLGKAFVTYVCSVDASALYPTQQKNYISKCYLMVMVLCYWCCFTSLQ